MNLAAIVLSIVMLKSEAIAEVVDFVGSGSNAAGGVFCSSSWGLLEALGPNTRFADITIDTEYPFDDGSGGITLLPAIRYNHLRVVTETVTASATGSFLVPGTLNEFKEIRMEVTFFPAAVDVFGAGAFRQLNQEEESTFRVDDHYRLSGENKLPTSFNGTYRVIGPTETAEGVLSFGVDSGDTGGSILPWLDATNFPTSVEIGGSSLGGGAPGAGAQISVDGIDVVIGPCGIGTEDLPFTLSARTSPLGDTDFNGVIDVTDLNNVRNNFGFGRALGDTDGNGAVDIEDLNNVRNNFGYVSPGAAPVPEPGGWALLAIGATALAFAARRKSC